MSLSWGGQLAWKGTVGLMSWEQRVERNPDVLVGKPVVAGTRISVELVLELLADGWDEKQLLDGYPSLEREDTWACLHYAAATLRAEGARPISV